MNSSQEDEILEKLVNNFKRDHNLVIDNLLKKSSLVIKNDLIGILGTDDKVELNKARKWVETATETLSNDLKETVNGYLDNYKK